MASLGRVGRRLVAVALSPAVGTMPIAAVRLDAKGDDAGVRRGAGLRRDRHRRSIDTGFSGWSGSAGMTWLQRDLGLGIGTFGGSGRAVVVMADRTFEPGFAGDHVCLEPMIDAQDANHAFDGGGLVVSMLGLDGSQ